MTKRENSGTQERLVNFVKRTNWVILALVSAAGFLFAPLKFALGILFGGLIVTVNFHLLARTLRNAFRPPHIASTNVILAKYYIRFAISAVIIFLLIYNKIVHPLSLFIGLSVVVASIFLATIIEFNKLFPKEEAI